MSIDESLEVTDPVSGVVAKVVCRTLRASTAEPCFVILGDMPINPGWSREQRRLGFAADAAKLYQLLYDTLPGDTLNGLVRNALVQVIKDLPARKREKHLASILELIELLSGELAN